MDQKKVLVFGASGFLGRAVVNELLKNNQEVVAVTRYYDSNNREKFNECVKWIEADLYNASTWENILEDVDVVIDLVGLLRENPELGLTHQHVIYDAAKVIGDAADRKNIKRFIFVSAHLDNPKSPEGYIYWKKESENYLLTKSFETVILRPGMMYGKNKEGSIDLANKIKETMLRELVDKVGPLPVEYVAKMIAYIVCIDKPKSIYSIEDINQYNLNN